MTDIVFPQKNKATIIHRVETTVSTSLINHTQWLKGF